jgi:CDP-alcohol phosphatidyltransferase
LPASLSAGQQAGQPLFEYAEGDDPQQLDRQWTGWSDWLDGYAARRFNQQSTLGSCLDPLADKVLICSVVAALGIQVLHARTTAPALVHLRRPHAVARCVHLHGISICCWHRELYQATWQLSSSGVTPFSSLRASQRAHIALTGVVSALPSFSALCPSISR